MSRAFTKEDDAGEDIPEKPVPAGPNYVTPRGLEMLQEAARTLVKRRETAQAQGADVKTMDRDLRYLEARISSAMVVPAGSGAEARFGAHVTLQDSAGEKRTFQIVGEDEARTRDDLMPWSAPLALAILGAKAGETINWDGPDGRIPYKILTVDYSPRS